MNDDTPETENEAPQNVVMGIVFSGELTVEKANPEPAPDDEGGSE